MVVETEGGEREAWKPTGVEIACCRKLSKMFALKKHGKDSTTTIDDLCDSLLVEILSKLSPRKMVRATVVCKLWHRLISTLCIPTLTSSPPQALLYGTFLISQDPEFVQKTLTWDLSWFNNQTTPLRDLCHFLPFQPSPTEVLDCVHGFFLFLNRSTNYFYVCNLSTEHYASFPNSPSEDDDFVWSHQDCSDGAAAALIFDPLCKVAYICKDTRFTLRIFTVAQARWDSYRFDYQRPFGNSLGKRSIFFDGFLHVLALDGYLMRFGIKQGIIQTIKLPEIVAAGKHPIGGIAVSQGHLHYTWNDTSDKMMVWMLGQGGHLDDWVLKYTIPCRDFLDTVLLHSNHLTSSEQLTNGSSSDQQYFGVLSFDPASDVLYIADFNNIYRYDPCINKVEKLCSVDRPRIIFGLTYYAYHYSVNLSSLYSVCMGDE